MGIKKIKTSIIAFVLALTACMAVSMVTAQDMAFADEKEGVTIDMPEIVMKPAGLPDSDLLFRAYADITFGTAESGEGGAAVSKRTHLRRERLNDQEKIVYDKIKARISAVAAGEEEYAGIDIPLSELGIESSYTAEELGLETIFDKDDPSAVSEEARQRLNSKMQVGLMNILGAILGDFPYELYWYDKTNGIAFEPPKIIGINNGEGGALVFDSGNKIKFKMYVALAYSKAGTVQTVYADKEKTGATKAAAENAKKIVEDNKGLSDLGKLEAYMNEVITLTDYNYDSVEEYALYNIYGDPWQLIYVFDNDPETKVVCEGYSKAFQYLCDLTDFEDKTIHCNQATGDMYTESGAGGPHMWNIVTIGDNNYLVDLTNNDTVTDDPAHKATTTNDELLLGGVQGSFESGYFVEWGDPQNPESILYVYDEDTLRFFDEEELLLSPKSYKEYLADLDKPKISITISLLGDSYHKGTDEVHTLRAGNLTEWIAPTELEINYDSSVLDALNKLLISNGYSGKVKDGNYVSAISRGDESLEEKDNGAYSGWMYTINGEHSDLGVAEQGLEDGDEVVFHYTDDYRLENDDLDTSKADQVKSMIAAFPETPAASDADKVAECEAALAELDANDTLLAKLVTPEERKKLEAVRETVGRLVEKAEEEKKERAARELENAKQQAILAIKDKISAAVTGGADSGELAGLAVKAAGEIKAASSQEELAAVLNDYLGRVGKLGVPGSSGVNGGDQNAGKKDEAGESAFEQEIKAAKSLKVKGFKVKPLKKRKARISWKKNTGASGYVIYKSAKKKGKYKLAARVSKNKLTKKVIGKLKKGKKYYIKMRPFKRIGGRIYYGKWTKIKRVNAK